MSRKIGMHALMSALFALIAALLFISLQSLASEHPKEHPSGKPSSGEVPKPLTKKEMSAAIQSYVEKEAKKYGGYYEIYDDLQKKNLYLKLKKIHDERLSHVGNDVYFFCVDLVDKDGKVYDLDFFMKRGPGSDLNVTEVTIHKQEGKERYAWYEEKGIWKKKWLVNIPAQPTQKDKLPAGKRTIGDHPNPLPAR
jgi:hypothetical protein